MAQLSTLLDRHGAIGFELNARSVADAVWLAWFVRSEGLVAPEQAALKEKEAIPKTERPDMAVPQARASDRRSSTNAAVPDQSKDEKKVPLQPSRSYSPDGRVLNHRIGALKTLGDTQGYKAALGAFRIRSLAPSRQIDEAATIDDFAERGGAIDTPAMLRGPRRWLRLSLIVEAAPSNGLWAQPIDEFEAVLRQHGTFRQLRRWILKGGGKASLIQQDRNGAEQRGESDPFRIGWWNDELVVLISDYTSNDWWNGRHPELLRRWSSTRPVVLMHALPERLWQRSWVGGPDSVVYAARQACANAELILTGYDSGHRPRGPFVPVVGFDPGAFGCWAANVMGDSSSGMRAIALDARVSQFGQPAEAPPVEAALDASELVMAFKMSSSDQARQMAKYMSLTAPLSFPVMRWVQGAAMPDTDSSHLAEFVLGGLLEQVAGGAGCASDDVVYDFIPGVRGVLQNGIPISHATEILQMVGAFLEANQSGTVRARTGVMAFPDLETLPPDLRAFALVSREFLDRIRANSLDASKFIRRRPRVQIDYDIDLYGTEKRVQLPFVMGVMADLSGRSEFPLPLVPDRKFLDIDEENFNDRMAAIAPRVVFTVPNVLEGNGTIGVDLVFRSMEDFLPGSVARQTDWLSGLLHTRENLGNLIQEIEGDKDVEDNFKKLLGDEKLLNSFLATTGPEEAAIWLDENASSLKFLFRLSKKGGHGKIFAYLEAVRALARHMLDGHRVGNDVVRSTFELIEVLDKLLSGQINAIMHHPEFQTLEGTWRGLHYLVSNTESDDMLNIRVINISKAELGQSFGQYKDADWDHSPLFKKVYEEEYGMLLGRPFGCLVGDYAFDSSPPDVELLSAMAKLSAAAYSPFIAGASPTVMQMDSWQELANPRDLAKIFTTQDYASWRSLRESEDSRYIGLAMPRFLSRLPYGAKTSPVEEFDFEEDTGAADPSKYTWSNAAYAMAVNINRSFKLYGWCARIRGIESGGLVEGLPTHTFPTDDGGMDMMCPTEIAINYRREAELAKNGFMPLVHRKNTDFAAFIGAQSLHNPFEYDDPDATANAILAARWPYLFACCRFAQYLKCIVRDKIGSFGEREDMRRWLQEWIMNYIDGDPENSTEETKCVKPLVYAEVSIAEDPSRLGIYIAEFSIQPHYQLEGLTAPITLVSKLPSGRAV